MSEPTTPGEAARDIEQREDAEAERLLAGMVASGPSNWLRELVSSKQGFNFATTNWTIDIPVDELNATDGIPIPPDLHDADAINAYLDAHRNETS